MINYVFDNLGIIFVELFLQQLQTVSKFCFYKLISSIGHHCDTNEVNKSESLVVGKDSVPQSYHIV